MREYLFIQPIYRYIIKLYETDRIVNIFDCVDFFLYSINMLKKENSIQIGKLGNAMNANEV